MNPESGRRRTRELAVAFGMTDDDLARWQSQLAEHGQTLRFVYVAGWMHATVALLAEDHRDECPLGHCRICEHVRKLLTVAVATQELVAEDEFDDLVQHFYSGESWPAKVSGRAAVAASQPPVERQSTQAGFLRWLRRYGRRRPR